MTSKFDPQTTCLKLRCKQMFYEEKDEAALELSGHLAEALVRA